MPGTLDIRQSTVAAFDVRYEDLSGNSFAGSMNEHDVHHLLYEQLALDCTDQQLDSEYQRLLREGHINFPEVELKDSDLAGAGLKYLPAEG
jgi:hypothetical protein